MIVPLDNLYDWMSGIFNDDCIIYRFYPHGSKKLENLNQHSDQTLMFRDFHQRIPMICHDQEPLNFALYENIDPDYLKNLQMSRNILISLSNDDLYWRYMASRNLLSVITPLLYDRCILLNSEKRSLQHQYYNSWAVSAFWWSHAVIARDWYRFAEVDPRLSYKDRFHYDFNVYARDCTGTRVYRQDFINEIDKSDILKAQCRITRPGNQTPSSSSATYDTDHYSSCAIDLVLETLFDDPRLHLTEKILRPIACRKPFILAASHHSLDYLKSYGFKTFDGLIDESYDLIEDPMQRQQSIINEMLRISRLPLQQKSYLYEALHRVAEFNQKHFFSKNFISQVLFELNTNVNSAINEIKQNHQLGIHYLAERRIMPRHMKLTDKKFLPHYNKDRIEFLLKLRANRRKSRRDQ